MRASLSLVGTGTGNLKPGELYWSVARIFVISGYRPRNWSDIIVNHES